MRSLVSIAALAFLLAGCGGEDSTSGTGTIGAPLGGSTQTPTPTSASPIFGALGQTTPQSFTTLSFSLLGQNGPMDIVTDLSTLDRDFIVGLRLDASRKLVMTVGGVGEGTLFENGGRMTGPPCDLLGMGFAAPGGTAWLERGRKNNGDCLSYTATGSWVSTFGTSGNSKFDYKVGYFVYGIPAPSTGIPSAGKATFKAGTYYGVELVEIEIDFASRMAVGTIQVGNGSVSDPDTYSLQPVALSADGTSFAGQLIGPDGQSGGEFVGQLTGPHGEEIMGLIAAHTGDVPSLWVAGRE